MFYEKKKKITKSWFKGFFFKYFFKCLVLNGLNAADLQGFTAKLLFVTDLSYFCFINIIDVSKCLPLNEAPETAVEPVRETRLCLKSMLILKMLFLHRKAKHFCLILLLCADFHTRFSSYAVFKRCSYD